MDPGKWLIILVFCVLTLAISWPAQSLTGSITIFYPDNESWTNETNDTFPFIYGYVDPGNATALCYLFIDSPDISRGSMAADNNTQEYMNSRHAFSDGERTWWITCSNGTNITSEVMTFNADRSTPSISLVSPANGSSLRNGTITFTYLFVDSVSPQAYCTLHVNSSLSSGAASNDVQKSTGVSLGAGSYEWYVECSDNASNSGISGTYVLDLWELGGISITSPQNTTYSSKDDIPLTFLVSGTPDWIGFSLDGASNVTISGNTTFDVEAEGPHSIEVYATDTFGKLEYDSVHFTVRLSHGMDFISPSRSQYAVNRIEVNVTPDADAVWCGVSLDSGSNLSMSGEAPRSWSYNLTGLSEGGHSVRVWCNDSNGFWFTNSTSFNVMLTGFSIDPRSPANTTYWNTTALDIVITLGRDADSCEFYLDSEGPMMMSETNPKRWYYNITNIAAGSFRLKVHCSDSVGLSDTSSLVFTVKLEECESNTIGICSGAQNCTGSKCVDIDCGECAYAASHACHSYECCDDDECLDQQRCTGNACVDISCDCGEIRNHTCIEYGCCSNFDCDANQQCDLATHSCIGKALIVVAPESVIAGQVFEITVMNQEGGPIEGASVKVDYPGGGTKTVITNSEGIASAVAIESGSIQITATAEGYNPKISTIVSLAGFNWWIVVIIIVMVLAAGGGYFYWQQMPPLTLIKRFSGQNVTLAVKNRTPDNLENILVVDSIPRGAYIGCNLNPRVENFGNEDHLTWFASLGPGEEIVISYQAANTSEGFMVKVGDEEYSSGYGIMSIVQEVRERIGKLLPKRKEEDSPGTAAPAPPA